MFYAGEHGVAAAIRSCPTSNLFQGAKICFSGSMVSLVLETFTRNGSAEIERLRGVVGRWLLTEAAQNSACAVEISRFSCAEPSSARASPAGAEPCCYVPFWPLADPNFTLLLVNRTSAIEKSGCSALAF